MTSFQIKEKNEIKFSLKSFKAKFYQKLKSFALLIYLNSIVYIIIGLHTFGHTKQKGFKQIIYKILLLIIVFTVFTSS